jgi:hypothetical protein
MSEVVDEWGGEEGASVTVLPLAVPAPDEAIAESRGSDIGAQAGDSGIQTKR